MAYKDKEKKKAAQKRYYEKHKDRITVQRRIKGLQRHKEIREWMAEYKSTLKCKLCPEYDSCCLDFHHKDPSKKENSIAIAMRSRWSKNRILKEIAKCVVVCSNCHRKIHAGKITISS